MCDPGWEDEDELRDGIGMSLVLMIMVSLTIPIAISLLLLLTPGPTWISVFLIGSAFLIGGLARCLRRGCDVVAVGGECWNCCLSFYGEVVVGFLLFSFFFLFLLFLDQFFSFFNEKKKKKR